MSPRPSHLVALLALLAACNKAGGSDSTSNAVLDLAPELPANPIFTDIGTQAADLDTPRDLQFHPDRPTELWVVNQDTDGVVVFVNPGTADQKVRNYQDPAADHFMDEVSSLAFGDEQDVTDATGVSRAFGSCQESKGDGDLFMGPVLWPSERDTFAEGGLDGPLGSHLDMLHQSPDCMGIAWDHRGNKYWVFDGYNGELKWFDFQTNHGYGNDDHADGVVRFYPEVKLDRVAGVPGHLVLDPDSGLLYIANTGDGEILEVDTRSGDDVGAGDCIQFEPLEDCREYGGVDSRVLVEGLDEPSGIALTGGHLLVSDHGTGEIIAYDLAGAELERITATDGPGVMGLEVGPDGTLWYADGENDTVIHVTGD